MDLAINIYSNVAVYVQIENQIRAAIASGKLKSGDQLPSVRELSEKTKVNPNTVAKAYRDLEVMGLLYTRRGMGVYVNKGVQAACRKNCTQETIGRLFEVIQEGKNSGIPKADLIKIVNASYSVDGNAYQDLPSEVAKLVG